MTDQLSKVFAALSDPLRRDIVARLTTADATVSELAEPYDVSLQAVSKHLKVLEDADLVVTRRSGREKLHFLNPVPIRLVHDRWIDKYTEQHITALTELKRELEEGPNQ